MEGLELFRSYESDDEKQINLLQELERSESDI